LEGSPCEPFGSDMKVKTGSNYFYPDVIVDCNFVEAQPYYTENTHYHCWSGIKTLFFRRSRHFWIDQL